jgi:hypothetical protein
MKKLLPILLASICFLPSVGAAQPLMTYTYADVAYQWTHVDESGINDANGLDTKISYSPVNHFALEGGYNYLSTKGHVDVLGDRFNFNIDQNVFSYGGAGWYSLQDDLDIVARVGGLHARATASAGGEDSTTSDNGVYAGLSLRYLATEDFEADLNVIYDRIENGAWTYGVTGLYAVHENVALKGEAAIDNDTDVALLAGIRIALKDSELF